MNANIVIREATERDKRAIVEFYMRLDHPGQKTWMEIMLDGRHPHVGTSNFIIAEDSGSGKLAASAIYMPWTYSYCGCLLKAIRMEEIFCDPAYQNRGIMRRILDRIGEITAEQGYLFELVYGKNAVYGHFGYTYGLPNEEEGYSYIVENEAAGDGFIICEAADKDIPRLAQLYEASFGRNLLTTAIGCKEIFYMKNIYAEGGFYVIKTPDGHICGFFHTQLDDKRIYMMEIDSTVSYYQLRPYILEFYRKHKLESIHFKLGRSHPVYTVFNGFYHRKLPSELGFVKVRSIPDMLLGISDVLNDRLSASPYANYSGAFTLAMHNKDEAYRLVFDGGRLREAAPVRQEYGEVCIERDRFIKLLFGRITADEMKDEHSMFFFENSDLRNLFEILLPPMQSHIVSVN